MNRLHLRSVFAAALAVATATLLGLASCGGGGMLDGPVDGAAAMGHVEQLVSFNPRHSGTEGAKKSAEYLRDQLVAMGIEAEIQEFTGDPRLIKGENGEPITFRNVIGKIPGPAEDSPILAFGAHYDAKRTVGHAEADRNFEFEGAIDGGGANGVVLELARQLKGRDNKTEIWLLFFDGEESIPWVWDTDQSLIGSRHFVKQLPADTRKRFGAFVLLDLIGDKDIKIDRDSKSDGDLQKVIASTAKAHGIEDRVYKYSSGTTDDHEPFIQFGMRAMLLIDFLHRMPSDVSGKALPAGEDYAQWWHTPEDTLDKMSTDALAFTGNLVWHALDGLEAEALEIKR